MEILKSLEPQEVFTYFEEICAIPHGSSNTLLISNYLVNFAKSHNLQYIQDEYNNVIIFKKGTSGYENSAPVILQGHMDMVCEKDADYTIDFAKDGLELQIANGVISAKGTTLGGDDGIAVAYALAILASTKYPHPPIEAVFTVDEEIGMLGAAAMDCSPLKSRIFLNIDSEEEGHLLVSCAGGATVTAHLPIETEEASGYISELTLSGLLGGHSGMEIDKYRANACVLLGRILFSLSQTVDFKLVRLEGGKKDNAIPRQSTATLFFASQTLQKKAQVVVAELMHSIQKEYKTSDPNISFKFIHKDITKQQIFSDSSTQRVIAALYNLPAGIQKMSQDIPNLVQTSLNLGILTMQKQEVSYSFSVRSSVGSEKEELIQRICCLTEALQGKITVTGNYPAWEYRKSSPLRELMCQVYKEQYGEAPIIEAIHAGVECGLFADKLPGLDCVSFGPDMKDIHTPKESMDVKSVQRTWEYLLEVLKRLQ